MGLFDNTSSDRDEVRIGVAEEEEIQDSKLKSDVEDKLDAAKTSKSKSAGSDTSLDELHRQNERIIELLEKIVDDKNTGNRVTDRKEDNNDQNVGSGMNELL